MPQLDALRTFAVGLVILFHWFPTGVGINRLPNGTIGVMVFFVISGFLITRILINGRLKIDAGQVGPGTTYRNFFMRRALRIFPLYYLTITLVWLLLPDVSDIDKHPLYYYFYGYNVLLHQTGNWADVLSPFWTLGVEEQLYLLWPWVVLIIPPARLPWAIGLLIVGAISFRAYSFGQGNYEGVLTPANLDSFGLGALWAYLITVAPASRLLAFNRQLPILAGAALLLFIGLQFLPGTHLAVVLFQRLVISLLSLYAVVGASRGFGGTVGAVLNNRVMQYIGRISYGIYVFHMLVPGFVVPLLLRLGNRFIPLPEPGYWSHRLVSLAVLLLMASVSWYAVEKPVNELKKWFV